MGQRLLLRVEIVKIGQAFEIGPQILRVERLGGFVGWTLVDKKVKEQYTGFFTGQADPQTASTFRSAGSDVVALRDEAAELLDAVCEDDDDWDAAEAAAIDVISTAYDEYFETLEDLGVNPKPVC